MNAPHTAIASMLDQLQPPIEHVRHDWEGVLHDAQLGGRRATKRLWRPRSRSLRMMLIALAASILLGIPVIAVGATVGWWFQTSHPKVWWKQWPQPVNGTPAIIASGHTHGQPWTGIAYASKNTEHFQGQPPVTRDTICLAIIVGSRSNIPNSFGCSPRQAPRGRGVLVLVNWSTPQPPLIAGAVPAKVAKVEVVLNPYPYPNGRTVTTTPKLINPPEIGHGIRFFLVPFPANVGINYILFFNSSGHLIEKLPWG